MAFEWDQTKSDKNLQERGFSFEIAHEFDWDAAAYVPDNREEYGEARYWVFGRVDDAPYCLTFTPRHGNIRIISARRMHEKEAAKYGI